MRNRMIIYIYFVGYILLSIYKYTLKVIQDGI